MLDLLGYGAEANMLQVKSVKPCLKQLQQCIQTISTLHDDEILPSNPADLFHWLPKEHMCVLVYLVSPVTLGHLGWERAL